MAEWAAQTLFAFQLLLLGGFSFYAFFCYLYGIAALGRPRLARIAHSNRPVAVVVVAYNEEVVVPGTLRACQDLTYHNKIIV